MVTRVGLESPIWVPGPPGQVHTVILPLMSALMGVNTGEPRQSGDKTRKDVLESQQG